MWALDWGWIEQTLNSHRSPPETEVSLSSLSLSLEPHSNLLPIINNIYTTILTSIGLDCQTSSLDTRGGLNNGAMEHGQVARLVNTSI